MKTIHKILAACIIALILGAPQTAQAQTYAKDDTLKRYPLYENAFKYLLQKPIKVESFKPKRFLDHFFITTGAGVNFLEVDKTYSPAGEASLHIGDWITPVHGIRLGIKGGFLRSGDTWSEKNKFVSGEIDYLMNLSALGAGSYSYSRPFEVSAVLGADVIYAKRNGAEHWSPGGHIGLLGTLRLSDVAFVYLEPRFYMYSDKVNPDPEVTRGWRHYVYGASLSAGLGYRLVGGENRRSSSYEWGSALDGLFLSAGLTGGMIMINPLKSSTDHAGALASLAVGKMFNPFTGLRLKGKGGFYVEHRPAKLKLINAQLDFLFNMTNLMGGYDDSRRLWVNGVIGADLAGSKLSEEMKWTPGAGGGLQFNFRTSRYSSFYIEPRVDVYASKFIPTFNSFRKYDITTSIEMGFTFYRNEMQNADRYGDNRLVRRNFWDNLFIQGGAGIASVGTKQAVTGSGYISPTAYLGVGTWFDKLSGLRISGYGSNMKYGSSQGRKMVEAGADYLLNFSNLIVGYNPDRRFEVFGALGGRLAMKKRTSDLHVGANASLQGLVHLNDMVGLFVEPSLQVYKHDFVGGGIKFANLGFIGRVNVGMNIRMRGFDIKSNNSLHGEDADARDKYLFISGGVQTSVNALRSLYTNFKVGYGQYYNSFAGWRLSAEASQNDESYSRSALDFDWMINLTTLTYGYNPDRAVTLNAFIGAGAGMEHSYRKGYFSPDIHAGGQMSVKVSPAISLFIEPQMSARAMTVKTSGKPVRMSVAALAGLAYNLRGTAAGEEGKGNGYSRWYASVAIGSGIYMLEEKARQQRGAFAGFNVEGVIGRWFNDASALQMELRKHNYVTDNDRSHKIESAILDYRVNMMRVENEDKKEKNVKNDKFKLSMLAGLSANRAAMESGHDVDYSMGLHLGLQGDIYISDMLDLTLKPDINIMNKGLGTKKPVYDFGVSAGLTYKF